MLYNLLQFWIGEKYFEIKKIGKFKNAQKEGYDHITTQAIEFDETKNKVCADIGEQHCKSCDALDIIYSKNRLNFIEFKQIIDTPDFNIWISGLSLPQKIKDSHGIVLHLIRNHKFATKFPCKDAIKKYKAYEKNYIIAFNLIDDATKRIAELLQFLRAKQIIQKQFHENYIQGENFNQPIYIKLNDFDAEYPAYI